MDEPNAPPGDPGGPTLADRARWAREALDAYLRAKGADPGRPDAPLEDLAGDLMADLMHLVAEGGDPAADDPHRAWCAAARDYAAERTGNEPDDADPALARVSAMEPRLARDALRTIWLAFYDPDGDGPPYDPDGEVGGGDLVDAVGEVFERLRLVPPPPDDPGGAEGAR